MVNYYQKNLSQVQLQLYNKLTLLIFSSVKILEIAIELECNYSFVIFSIYNEYYSTNLLIEIILDLKIKLR